MTRLLIPARIRIGFADYEVTIMTDEEEAKADHDGITDNNAHTIRLATSGTPPGQANTLLHELLHACWYMGDLHDSTAEEKIVAVLANQLCAVIRDNPEMFLNVVQSLWTKRLPNDEVRVPQYLRQPSQ